MLMVWRLTRVAPREFLSSLCGRCGLRTRGFFVVWHSELTHGPAFCAKHHGPLSPCIEPDLWKRGRNHE